VGFTSHPHETRKHALTSFVTLMPVLILFYHLRIFIRTVITVIGFIKGFKFRTWFFFCNLVQSSLLLLPILWSYEILSNASCWINSHRAGKSVYPNTLRQIPESVILCKILFGYCKHVLHYLWLRMFLLSVHSPDSYKNYTTSVQNKLKFNEVLSMMFMKLHSDLCISTLKEMPFSDTDKYCILF
jgi:hypothetical protein